ncbi:TatD family hydrolase [Peribacillus sp. TH16]|uniref:TatD family hydrolase n=1 Tax=unclassified Peribacillus TaxID=2675266 RepID=UPI0019113E15|nr:MULTISPECIES: TatD family hydrolase [unclassified Peribacillus]MBK5462315.1 TatD family hydrolase [Peribacillus sp. TH27]MBK5484348.1 TatD family hydrolase [Peribacillus sp. TH16]
MKIIDSHIHLDRYDESKQKQILTDMEKAQVESLLTVSMNLTSSIKNYQLSIKDSRIKPAFGFHPEQSLPSEEEVNDLLSWMRGHRHNMFAVGEVGLPYYLRQENPSIDTSEYIEILDRFLAFAKEFEKPVILHAVYDDAPVVCDLLEKNQITKAHFHWFKGDIQTVERMVKNGYHISITPDVCYEEEIQELVSVYPLKLMMLETDGPWPFEGVFKREWTHPGMMHDSARQIASIKNLPIEIVYETLYQNTKDFYHI